MHLNVRVEGVSGEKIVKDLPHFGERQVLQEEDGEYLIGVKEGD
jgi:hypothetical protein